MHRAVQSELPPPSIDTEYLEAVLRRLVETPSPSGMTDDVVGMVCQELEELGVAFELTRRGAIRADLYGEQKSPDRAIVSHLDTLGAMVKSIRENGRLEVVPIGHWSARFAEGARVTIHGDEGVRHRGTLLPLMASGHTFSDAVDDQPGKWTNLELRIDARTTTRAETEALGIEIGDIISIDPRYERTLEGFINSRHLDDKAGVATMLAAARSIIEGEVKLPIDCHLLFTISEEVGVGASHILHGDVAELVSIDNGTIAPGQNTSEYGVTVSMQDSSGPFDWHLTRHLLQLCRQNGIEHRRDVFRHYRSDAAAALEAGNDIRTALLCFAVDASHGYERTHMDSLQALGRLLVHYMRSEPLFKRDTDRLGPVGDLPVS